MTILIVENELGYRLETVFCKLDVSKVLGFSKVHESCSSTTRNASFTIQLDVSVTFFPEIDEICESSGI